jgi:hypothetical protein
MEALVVLLALVTVLLFVFAIGVFVGAAVATLALRPTKGGN